MRSQRLCTAIALIAVITISSGIQTTATAMTPDTKADAAIRAVIEAQRQAWNRGSIEGYMEGYARAADTVFVSGDNVTHGWQTVLDHYKKGYDSKEKMGELTFSDLEITLLSKDSAVVVGRWHLQRAKDAPRGIFTLVFRKTKLGWKIVHDHTSSAA